MTKIQWATRTWNPTTGCNKVSAGCKNCYAMVMHRRLQAMGKPEYESDFLSGAVEQPQRIDEPLKWRKPARIFVNSMSDLFHPAVSDEFLRSVMNVVFNSPRHEFLVLTKRPERMRDYFTMLEKQNSVFAGLKNLWLGVSAENQQAWDERIPILQDTPAAVRFVSAEPLIDEILPREKDAAGIHWLIVGGESGKGARKMCPSWATTLSLWCARNGIAYFFKQFGSVYARQKGWGRSKGGKPKELAEWAAESEYCARYVRMEYPK